MEKTKLIQAKKWFEDNGIRCYTQGDEELFIIVGDDIHVMVSHSEIEYRAEINSEAWCDIYYLDDNNKWVEVK